MTNLPSIPRVVLQVSLIIIGAVFLLLPSPVFALVATTTTTSSSSGVPSDSQQARLLQQQRLQQELREALSPPSGKLSISPELVISESTDPTSILLQSNAIKVLSEQLRTTAKANAAWISGSITTLATFCSEQDQARGKIPGPIPVIYCGSSSNGPATDDDVDGTKSNEYLQSIAATGAHGIMIPVLDGLPVETIDQIVPTEWADTCQQAIACGLVPIPEVTLQDEAATNWKDEDVSHLINRLTEITGIELPALLLTVQHRAGPVESTNEEPASSSSSSAPLPLPPVSKELRRRVPIVGSIRVAAGENRMGDEMARFKAAGYSGTLLRHECIPEALRYSNNRNMDLIRKFWTSCIGDLKSTRSKSFSFRAKNNMEKSHSEMWANYMKEVNDSGAMGDESDATGGPAVNSAAGEYRGFA